ncbi:class I adenylate-forming enzyme family protein [Streptomyces sp. NPDC048441]|uniref:class I adenylate-forming enzyme family protein n=1 Tax=Streptomyces sp. NPDC048441 TaxID=3365552 RepID=UPI00371E50E4
MSVIPDLLSSWSAARPDSMAIAVDGGGSLTYAQWESCSNAAAHALLSRGVGRGDRVALYFTGLEWLEYAVAYMGVLKSGATAMHLSDTLPPAEMRRRFDECAAGGIIHGTRPAPFTADWAAPAAALDGARTDRPDVGLTSQDIADILYTSGTTGLAKAFTNPHGNPTHGRGIEGVQSLDEWKPVIAPIPLSTTASVTTLVTTALTTPAPFVLCAPWDEERVAALVAERRAGSLMGTPWTAIRMVNARVHTRHDLTGLTLMAFSSATLPPATALALREMVPGVRILTAYSQAEASPAVILNEFDPARPLATGLPAPGTGLMVCDERGRSLPAGEVGEIRLSTSAPGRRYLSDALNRTEFVQDWKRTGDLGLLDEDGMLYLVDRSADVMRGADGRPVYSIEIEAALYAHPAISEAAVVGIPASGRRGGRERQTMVAVVVSADGSVPEDLGAFLADTLPGRCVPQRFLAWPDLPRGTTGKVLKREVCARLTADRGVRPEGELA